MGQWLQAQVSSLPVDELTTCARRQTSKMPLMVHCCQTQGHFFFHFLPFLFHTQSNNEYVTQCELLEVILGKAAHDLTERTRPAWLLGYDCARHCHVGENTGVPADSASKGQSLPGSAQSCGRGLSHTVSRHWLHLTTGLGHDEAALCQSIIHHPHNLWQPLESTPTTPMDPCHHL